MAFRLMRYARLPANARRHLWTPGANLTAGGADAFYRGCDQLSPFLNWLDQICHDPQMARTLAMPDAAPLVDVTVIPGR